MRATLLRAINAAAAIAAVVLLCPLPGSGQNAITLETVLARLHTYLSDYAERLPATIASEHYVQFAPHARLPEPRVATIDSDFGIIRLPGVNQWLGFRDVLAKDGKAVSDRQRRLDSIFQDPSVNALAQARMVADESARHNIGPIYRTINNPALVLELLDARNARPMRFSKGGETTTNGMTAWEIRFREVGRPTVVSSVNGQDAPSEGRAWVDPVTGTLLRSEVTVGIPGGTRGGRVKATVKVTFLSDPKLGFWVPSTMTEVYETSRAELESGEATYSNYRMFTVDTRVIINSIPNP